MKISDIAVLVQAFLLYINLLQKVMEKEYSQQ